MRSWYLVAVTEKVSRLEPRLFALKRLYAPNESLKSTLFTTNAINSLLAYVLAHTQDQTTLLCCCYNSMILIHFLFFWLSIAANTFGQITAAPSCPIQADPWHSQVGLLVQKRGISTFCDSNRKCMSTASSHSFLLLTRPSPVYCFQPAACVSGSDG